jgi:hypothetical protein
MSKLAKVDAAAMNHLLQHEASRLNVKVAAAGEDPQAFEDHEEYLATVDAVLKEDKSQSWDPNNPILD